MKTYQKLSVLTLLASLLVFSFAGYSQAFKPGYMEKQTSTNYECPNQSDLLPGKNTVSSPDWNRFKPGEPSPLDLTAKPKYTGSLQAPREGAPIMSSNNIWINNYSQMTNLRNEVKKARELRRDGYKKISDKTRLRKALSTDKEAAREQAWSIRVGKINNEQKTAFDNFTESNNTSYTGYEGAVTDAENSTNQALRDAYRASWGDGSSNYGKYQALDVSLKDLDKDQDELRAEAALAVKKSCEKQKLIDQRRDDDIATIVDDKTQATTLETNKATRAITKINTDRNEAIADGKAELESAVELEKEEAANAIIAVIEEKEGEKVEANNTARDSVIENTISAEDAITGIDDEADDLVRDEQETAADAIAALRLEMNDEIVILREGITSRMDEMRGEFDDRRSEVRERNSSNNSTIRSRWSGKLNAARQRADQARSVLRKKPGANWSNGNRQQLLQDQRRAAAQLAKSLKTIRWAKSARDRQLSAQKVRYQKQLAAIRKQERRQTQIIEGPINAEIAKMQKSLNDQIQAILAKRDGAIAEINIKRDRDKTRVTNRTTQLNNTILADLATALATLDRQQLQESKQIDTTSKIEVKKLDRAWTSEERGINNTADGAVAEVEEERDTVLATLNQEAAKTIKTENREADDAIKTVVEAEEATLLAARKESTGIERSANALVRTFESDMGTAQSAWNTEVNGPEGIKSKGAERADSAYDQYKTDAEKVEGTQKTAFDKGKKKWESHYKSEKTKIIEKVYKEGIRDVNAAKKQKD